jgi:hypothetical protein
MKKVVRMLGLCALVALAFTACKKNDTQKVTFTGHAAQPTGDVRTHISDGTFLVWSENDQIKVFNEAGDDMDFTVQSSAGKPGVAVFTAEAADEVAFVADLETADYAAFYPNAVVDENDKVVMVIPAEQDYYTGKEIGNNLYPMVGFNNHTDNFEFTSNAGFLNVRFQVSNTSEVDTFTIDKLVLRSKGNNDLTGNMIYEKDGSGYVFEGTGNVVTLSGDPIAIIKGSAKDFTFVLPAGALASGFDLDLYLGDELVETFEGLGNGENTIAAMDFRAMTTGWLPKPTPVTPN